MPTLIFNGESYDVTKAVRSGDSINGYSIHGYDDAGVCVVAIEGISDMSCVSYNSSYADAAGVFEEPCNEVRYVGSELILRDGSKANGGAVASPVSSSRTISYSNEGQFLRVDKGCNIEVSTSSGRVGAEVEVFRNTQDEVAICPLSGVSFVIPGATGPSTSALYISAPYASVVLKQIDTNVWSIQGAI